VAHLITASDSVATGRGIRPWHGLGVTVPDLMTPAQAVRHAGLGWSVSLQPLAVSHPDFAYLAVPAKAVVRMDTGTVLGVVGDRYVPVQNTDLVAVLDAIVENGAKIDTAGSLLGGRIVWFAALVTDFEAAGELHQDYLVISHGHDGSRAVTIRRTTVRVVCWNTLQEHDRQAGASYAVRHTESAQARIGAIGRLIAAGAEARARFQAAARRMARSRLSEREQFEFVLRSLGLDPTLEVKSIQRKIEAAKAALAWERSQTEAPESVWAALQGVTHYLAHEEASKGSCSAIGKERRLVSAVLDGERAKIAAKSFRTAAQLVGA
jgi:phage/plasmid-like protein (TIGR03299 family)